MINALMGKSAYSGLFRGKLKVLSKGTFPRKSSFTVPIFFQPFHQVHMVYPLFFMYRSIRSLENATAPMQVSYSRKNALYNRASLWRRDEVLCFMLHSLHTDVQLDKSKKAGFLTRHIERKNQPIPTLQRVSR